MSNVIQNLFIPRAPEGTEIRSTQISKRADAKLNYVRDIYEFSLGRHFVRAHNRFFDKQVYLKELRYIDELRMYYRVENRFFAASYDLCYETFIPARGLTDAEDGMKFSLKLGGGLRIRNVDFMCNMADISESSHADGSYSSADSSVVTQKIAKQLRNELIKDRIVSCAILGAEISYDAESDRWRIWMRSMIGSSTWNLIPPVMQLIKPKEEECLRTIELMELFAAAVL